MTAWTIIRAQPHEVPAILQPGKEVLTSADPRHVANGGLGGGDIKIDNAIDAGDFVSKGTSTMQGQRSILNFIRENPGAVKEATNQ